MYVLCSPAQCRHTLSTAVTKAKGDPKFKRRPKLMYVALQLQPDILLDFTSMCLIFLIASTLLA